MKTLLFVIFLSGVSLITAQSFISETNYIDTRLKCVVLDTKYPAYVAEEGIQAYMNKLNYRTSLNIFTMTTYKNVYLQKMSSDSSPYVKYNFRFKFEILGSGSKRSNFIIMLIIDNANNIIDFTKYPSILESGKTWLNEFGTYFFNTFMPEREIRLTEQEIIDAKKYKEQTYKDSIETVILLKNKIGIYESELLQLKSTLVAQEVIFKNSIIKQNNILDSLGNKLDSLRINYRNRER